LEREILNKEASTDIREALHIPHWSECSAANRFIAELKFALCLRPFCFCCLSFTCTLKQYQGLKFSKNKVIKKTLVEEFLILGYDATSPGKRFPNF
jgi:hypothetical protein